MRQVQVRVCDFRRTKSGELERGIAIGDVDTIVDSNGNRVKSVWDYYLLPDHGCMHVLLGTVEVKKVTGKLIPKKGKR